MYLILDEFILAGELQETSKKVVRLGFCSFNTVTRFYVVSWRSAGLDAKLVLVAGNHRENVGAGAARVKLKSKFLVK